MRWAVLVVGLLGLALLGVGVSTSSAVGMQETWAVITRQSQDRTSQVIVRELRLPRVLLACLMGAALGASGAVFQAIFRNPLADPFAVGASSGAAAGAATAIVLGLGAVSMGAFVGALLAVLVVYSLAVVGRLPMVSVLLAGLAISTMLGGLVWLMMSLRGEQLPQIVGWLMGSLSGRGWAQLQSAGPIVVVSVMVLSLMSRSLDALALGEEAAQSLGVNTRLTLFLALGFSTLMTAAAVSVGGIVGFVGLAAPHLARRLMGAAHRRLIPASAICGAGLMILADLAARTVVPSRELPLGAMTSVLGGPLFLWVLYRQVRWPGGLQ
ncbi:MAG: FecCD family ABC transporter permease [Fimbriiglobus sp.]